MGKSRTSAGRLNKDGNEVVIREIRRVFAELGNRIHLGACGQGERLERVLRAVMEKIQRPWRLSLKQWRQLVWIRLRTFKNQGVLQFDESNVARLSRRQMKRAESDLARCDSQSATPEQRAGGRRSREGRPMYRNTHRIALAA